MSHTGLSGHGRGSRRSDGGGEDGEGRRLSAAPAAAPPPPPPRPCEVAVEVPVDEGRSSGEWPCRRACGMHSTARAAGWEGQGVEATTASAEDFLSFDMGSPDDSSKNHGGSGRSGNTQNTQEASPRQRTKPR